VRQKKALNEIKEKGVITMENALPILLHSQYNHILHLEEKMVTKEDVAPITNMAIKDDITSAKCDIFSRICSEKDKSNI
jgi:hypothetical protein